MGMLIEGEWQTDAAGFAGADGSFRRRAAVYRHWITADGQPGPTGEGGFRAEAGRYILYVSLACPWAQRTLILRAIKGLKDVIAVAVVSPLMGDDGWTFASDFPGVTGDPLGHELLREIYLLDNPRVTTRATVPLLWDRETRRIVSNESADIIRMFDSAFPVEVAMGTDHYPAPLRPPIDAVNLRIYETVNNGVYRAGFATTQTAHAEAVMPLFATLDWIEARLARHRYLMGEAVTEADWRLFPTILRFDPVYHGHFKCNLRRVADYPNLLGWLRELAQWPGVADTIDLEHICHHYYRSHPTVNPSGIVPLGRGPDLSAPHGRDAIRWD